MSYTAVKLMPSKLSEDAVADLKNGDFKEYFIKSGDTKKLTRFLACQHSFPLFAKLLYEFKRELPEHSKTMYKVIDKYDQVLIKAARGHLKSTTLQLYAAWVMVYQQDYKRRKSIDDRLLRILQLSYSQEQANEWHTEFQAFLKLAIEMLELPVVFKIGDLSKQKTVFMGAVLKSKGITGSLRGKHPHIILADDLLTDKNMISPELMRTIFYQSIVGMAMPITKIIVVGTPLRYNDLLAELSELPDEKVRKYVSEGFPISKKGYVYLLFAAIKEDGSALWSERPLSWLNARRAEMGETRFAREYLCQPMSYDSGIFPLDLLNTCDRPEESFFVRSSSSNRIFVGCDLARSLDANASYTAFVLFEEIAENTLIFRDLWYKRTKSSKEKIKKLYEWDVKYGGLYHVNIENNQFQQEIVEQALDDSLRLQIEEEFLANGTLEPGQKLRRLRVAGDPTTSAKHSVTDGVASLRQWFETQRLLFPTRSEQDVRLSQMIKDDFLPWIENPNTGHFESLGANNDISMAVYIGIKGYVKKRRRSGFSIKGV